MLELCDVVSHVRVDVDEAGGDKTFPEASIFLLRVGRGDGVCNLDDLAP